MMLKNYYPRGDSTINVGETVSWNVNVNNMMGGSEYVSVRLRLDPTKTGSNDNVPSPYLEGHITEIEHVLMNNSTWTMPLDWTITSIDREENNVRIRSLNANGIDVNNLNVSSSSGSFRMVLELWRYDIESKNFVFYWSAAGDNRSAWNHIWFNVA